MSAEKKKNSSFLVLLIVDGWGISSNGDGNIFSLVKTEKYQELVSKYPATSLLVSPSQKKNVSRSSNYFTIGTGSFFQRKTLSLVEKLEKEGIKTLLISGEERHPELNFFFTGRKKIINSSPLTIKNNNSNKTTIEITDTLIKVIKKGGYGLIVVALSGLDSAGTTGEKSKIVEAVLDMDRAIGRILKAVLSRGGTMVFTAAAGKAESIVNTRTELINKKNTNNPVPFIIAGDLYEGKNFNFPEAPDGDLTLINPVDDISIIAPTILEIILQDSKIIDD